MSKIKSQLHAFGVSPHKSLGQNFLVDEGVALKIVAAAEFQPGDIAIEIGPGTGALTRFLSEAAQHVFAIELDARLLPVLESNVAGVTNLTIVQADALEVDFGALVATLNLPSSPPPIIRFVANLPYYITAVAIRRILESSVHVAAIVLTIQKEVAERIVAGPGEMSLLAASVQFYGTPTYVRTVSPGSFYPQPSVDSAVIKIVPHTVRPAIQPDLFFDVVRAGFCQPRKQIRNSLASGLGLEKAVSEALLATSQIDLSRRAETLTMDEWRALGEAWQIERDKTAAKIDL